MPAFWEYPDYDPEYQEEQRMHRKRMVKSNKPKTKKANHKHNYVDVIFSYSYNWAPSKIYYSAGRECSICGKLSHGFSKEMEERCRGICGTSIIMNDALKDFAEQEGLKVIPLKEIVSLDRVV